MANFNKFQKMKADKKKKSTSVTRAAGKAKVKKRIVTAASKLKKDVASVGKKTTKGLNSLKYRLAGKAGRAKMEAKGYVPKKKKK